MKIGIILNNQSHLPADLVKNLDGQMAMVRAARDGGWDAFLASMHYLNDGDVVALQQVPLLARLQAEAGDMTMGVAIFLLNLHNPVYTAETMATLDVIARGRFVLGIGLGYRDVEFDAFGVPKGQRVRRFTEYLDVIKRLWAGEAVSYEAPGCRLNEVRLNLLPVQRPRPPLWMAANHDNAVRRAARLGDCWYINPHATFATNRRQMGLYVAERRAAGLAMPSEVPCRKEIFCAETRQQALEMAAPFMGEKYRIYSRWGQDKVMPEDERLDLPFEELLKDRFVIGTPEDCHGQLRPYWEELGVTTFVFRTHFIGMPIENALHSMKLISSELLPELRKASPIALEDFQAE
ncbi:MAG: LLM class flavin-dependent oxidoreductase [SAR324 cluster bacterium]|nr:LLM class flavin-dependent oxidoreductase [SAR324 cluster bacterium]MCH8886309.1 LLM class flavin-dependent oxidoreductase [SAR324 cluster bacterium]